MICQYIDSRKDEFGVEPICQVLTASGIKIAPSTYYVKPWVLWRVFYLEPVVAGWGSSIVWLVLWLSAWSVSSGGGV